MNQRSSIRLVCFFLIAALNILSYADDMSERMDTRINYHTLMRSELLHERLLIVDMHTDALYAHVTGEKNITDESDVLEVDIPRLKKGGVDVEVFAIWPNPKLLTRGTYGTFVLAAIDSLMRVCHDESASISLTLSPDDLLRAVTSGKIAALIGVEGGHALEGRMDMLDTFYTKGVRVLTITWNITNEIGDAQLDNHKPHNGLSAFGVEVIKRMNKLGMIIDVSHADERTLDDILQQSSVPIIASHSNARGLSGHKRNLTDEQIRAIAEKGGVIGVMFWSPALKSSGGDATITDVLDHIDYIVRLVGVDHVAIGSDFDGLLRNPPKGLEDATQFSNLTNGLLERGYALDDVQKIMGENFLRMWIEVFRMRE
jgi:membrane dipeptidase